jgi:hypothetical protein
VVSAEELSWRQLDLISQLSVDTEFCTGICEERTWAREAEESPLLKPLPGNGWWRHSKLQKGLAGAVVIYYVCT